MRNTTRLALLTTFAVLSACGGDGTGPSDPVASSLVVSAGAGQSATVGTAVAVAPGVTVKDQRGNGMKGVVVTFALATGGGSITGALVDTTDAGGVARVSGWTLGTQAGSNTLTAAVAGLTPVTIMATATAGAPASLVFLTMAPAAAQSGVALTTQPSFQLKDVFGNNVPQAGVAVTAVIATGGGTLGGTATVNTNASGVASFTNLAITGTIGARTLSFSTSGLPALLSGPIQLNAGASATVTAVGATALSGTAGVAVGTPITVSVADQSGNPVAGATVTFAVTAGGGSVTGATPATSVSGQATLGSWTLGMVAGTLNTLSASVASLTPVVYSATPAAGAAAALQLTTQPGTTSAINGAALSPQPVVQVTDAFGNVVTQSGLTVTAAIASGGGVLGGTASSSTNASGVASFSGLSITGTAGAHSLSFSSAPLTAATSTSFTLTAGAATTLAVSGGDNQSGTVGAALPTAPAVLITDQSGNPVSGVAVTFAVASGGGSATGTSTNTNASGIATLGSWTLGTTAGANTLSAASGSLAGSPLTFTATGTPAAASQLTITTQPSSSATNGVALAQQPVLQLRDAFGNAVSQAGVGVTAAASGSGSVAGTSTIATNASGQASFTNLVLNGLLGSYTLSFTSTGLTGATSSSISLVAGAASQLALTTQPSTSVVNGNTLAQQPVVQLRDAGGNPVSTAGVSVAVAISGNPAGVALGGTTSALTNAGGSASFTNLSLTGLTGSYTLALSASGVTGTTSSSIGLLAGPATTIAISSGDGQSATVNSLLPITPAVLVTDQSGNLVSGTTVTFAVASGGGSATGTTAVSGASGIATVGGWTLGTVAGSNTLTATAIGLVGSPLSFTATGTPAPASQLGITTQPSGSATNGVALAQQPQIQLRDQFGNAVTGAGIGVTVTASSGGTLLGTTTVNTNAGGQASFSGLVLNGTVGSYTLSFASSGLTGATSGAIALGAGAASQMTVTTQPSGSVVNGNVLSQQPVIQLRDAGGNAVSSGGVNIVASLTGSPAGVTLGGTTTVATSGAGASSFTNLSLTGLVGSYTLRFTSGVLPALTSTTVVLQTGPATTIASSAGDGQTATVNTAVATNPSVLVTDQSGNPVNGVVVTFAIATGSGSIASGSGTTGASGLATGGSWTLGQTAGSNSLTATVASLIGSPVTFTATGTPAAATKVVITTQPSASATNGVALVQQPVLQLQDAFNNNVSQAGVSITASASAGATLSGTAALTTNAGGQVSFTNLSLTGLVGNYTLSFASTGLAGATSGTIALGAGAATQLAVTTQPSASVVNGGALAQQPVVQLRDAGGNNVPTAAVNVVAALTGAPAGVALGGTTTIATSGTGASSFTNLSLTGLIGSYTLTFTSAGVTPAVSSTIALQAGPGVSLTANSVQTQSGRVGIAATTLPSVKLVDASGNPVTGATVTFAGTAGGGIVTGGSQLTDALGLATVGGWTLGKRVITNTMTATAGALPALSFDASPVFTPSRVTAGAAHACATSIDGVPYCWGSNTAGALGDSSLTQRLTPVAVKTSLLFTGITGGQSHSCGITGAGAASCWGANNKGQLGVNNTSAQTAPVSVSAPGAIGSPLTFSTMELGFDHTCGVSTGLSLYCWGGNSNGQLGSGGTSTGSRTTPLLVNSGFSQVSAGVFYSCGVRSTTSVGNCWGINGFGQLGDSSKSQRTTATVVKGNLTFAEVVVSQTHSCGRTTGGLVYCWGANINGRIGQDTLTLNPPLNESLIPLQVAGLPSVAQVVVGGGHSCARTSGGQVFCWGLNDGGQLGDNSLSNRPTPVAVVMPGGVSSFTSIAAGSAFTCGVANTSAVYCWGDGANGQLANGSTTDQLVPGLITDP